MYCCGTFSVKNCQALEQVEVGDYSFKGYDLDIISKPLCLMCSLDCDHLVTLLVGNHSFEDSPQITLESICIMAL